MPKDKFVRVKSKKTGTEYTIASTAPRGSDVEVLKKPALNADGKPLRQKPKTTVEPSGRRETEPSTDEGKPAESNTSKKESQ